MNTDELNKSLSELETNLGNLKTAREQVEMVTGSADNLVSSTNELLKEISAVRAETDNAYQNNLNELSAKLTDFDEKLKKLISTGDHVVTTHIENLKKHTANLAGAVENSMEKVKDLHKEQLENFNNEFKDLLDKNISEVSTSSLEFKETVHDAGHTLKNSISTFSKKHLLHIERLEEELGTLLKESKKEISESIAVFEGKASDMNEKAENTIHEIRSLSVNTIDEVKKGIKENMASIIDVSEKQSTLIRSLQNNFDKKIELLNNDIKGLSKKHNQYNYVTWILLIIGFLAVFLKLV